MEVKPNVSIICAAARSVELTNRFICKWATLNPDCNIEFIIASPFDIEGVINVKDEMIGCSHANALCYEYCTGDYIAWLSDETMPTPGCLKEMVDFVKRNSVKPFLAEFVVHMVEEPESTPIKRFYVCDRQYARFGMASKETLKASRGFFDPEYHAHWVDSDLALRCWEAGGSVETCFKSVIDCVSYTDELYEGNRDKYFDLDFEYFLSKWRNKFPQMIDPNWRSWNIFKEVFK